jgi:drug/metabolite transporter (DMT)-like permease
MAELLKTCGWLGLTSIATVTCQLLAKYGVSRVAPLDFSGRPLATLLSIATSPFIVGGLIIQGCGFTIWLTVLAKSNLTWAVGVAGATVYLLTAALNWLVLGQGINAVQGAGLALLCIGAMLLSYNAGVQ